MSLQRDKFMSKSEEEKWLLHESLSEENKILKENMQNKILIIEDHEKRLQIAKSYFKSKKDFDLCVVS